MLQELQFRFAVSSHDIFNATFSKLFIDQLCQSIIDYVEYIILKLKWILFLKSSFSDHMDKYLIPYGWSQHGDQIIDGFTKIPSAH